MLEQIVADLVAATTLNTTEINALRKEVAMLVQVLRTAREIRGSAPLPAKGPANAVVRKKKNSSPAASEPREEAPESPSYEAITGAVNRLVNMGRTDAAVEVLRGFGVRSAKEVDKARWPELLSAFEAAGEPDSLV
jgi:hypothetical protein